MPKLKPIQAILIASLILTLGLPVRGRAQENPHLDRAKVNVKLTHDSAKLYASALLTSDIFRLMSDISQQLTPLDDSYDLAKAQENISSDIEKIFSTTSNLKPEDLTDAESLLKSYSNIQRQRFEMSWKASSMRYQHTLALSSLKLLIRRTEVMCQEGRADYGWDPLVMPFFAPPNNNYELMIGYSSGTRDKASGGSSNSTGHNHEGKTSNWYIASGAFALIGSAMLSSVVLAPFSAIAFGLSAICGGIGADTDMHQRNDEIHRLINAARYQFENMATQRVIVSEYKDKCSAFLSQIKGFGELAQLAQESDGKARIRSILEQSESEVPQLQARIQDLNLALCKANLSEAIDNKLCTTDEKSACELRGENYVFKTFEDCKLPKNEDLRRQVLNGLEPLNNPKAKQERDRLALRLGYIELASNLLESDRNLDELVSSISWGSIDSQLKTIRSRIVYLLKAKRAVSQSKTESLIGASIEYVQRMEALKGDFHRLLATAVQASFNSSNLNNFVRQADQLNNRLQETYKQYPSSQEVRDLRARALDLRKVMGA